jgi:hypothetical protein
MSAGIWLNNFGNEAYLKAAIDSVLKQSMDDFILYIADNRSPQAQVAEIISNAQRDRRVKILQPPPGPKIAGIPFMRHCWDYLTQSTNHHYTITLGGHDEWRDPDFLIKMVQKMELTRQEFAELGRKVAIVYPDTWQLDFEGNLCSHYGEIVQAATGFNFSLLPQIIISTVSSPQVFGLWNEEVRKQIPVRHACSGWDHLIVAEAALHGAIVFEGRTQLLMRKPPADDDLVKYGERHLDPNDLALKSVDFLRQMEWMIHILDNALNSVPAAAREHYSKMLTTSLAATYLSLRGMNLHICPGGPEDFFAKDKVRQMLGAMQHVEKMIRELTQDLPS